MAKSGSKHSIEDLAVALKAARENGQQVVPIVGAGLSADSGFPIIAAVVHYLGKLRHYIALRGPVYDYRKHNGKDDIFDRHFARYEAKPWEYLEDFGWPDWFLLNEDLFTKLDHGDRSRPVSGSIENAERKELNEILPNFNPRGVEQYEKLHTSIDEFLSEHHELREKIDSRFETNSSNSARFDVIGDWQRLILYFTNYRSDYADALFARFGATRTPGQGHRFLAFLSKVLAVRTILTFNFDSLIEEALETEGIRYKVFAMERGAGLPYPNLLRDQLSVIKAHGSTHALLLDEQLDRPLSKEYLRRFERITGKDPMLLVVGCSAGDRRLRDLVSHVLENSKQKHSVAWLHYEPDPPKFIQDSKTKRSRTLALPTNNPGATLLHLYSWFMSSNPASRVPYLAHVQQPIELAADRPQQSNNENSSPTVNGHLEIIAVDGSKFLTASQILLKRANEWARNSYQVIWIDLESLHTFAGVIGSIIDQCRKYDPDLPPSLLPIDIDQVDSRVPGNDEFVSDVIEQAAKRVVRALRRARYYLAIDGLGAYAWPATTHHGLTHMADARGAERRVKRLLMFLDFLDDDLGESRVGVGVDKITGRYSDSPLWDSGLFEDLFLRAKEQGLEPDNNPVFDFKKDFLELNDFPIFSLREIPPELKEILEMKPKRDVDLRCSALVAMVLFSLSCFRRTRPLVATTYLLEPLLGEFKRDRLHNILQLFTKQGHMLLQQLEGGSYWFNHSIRDELYSHNTNYTSTTSMRKCLNLQTGKRTTAEHRQRAVFQLFLCAITHHRISQIWYNHTFVQSRDTFAFLEYTYHRISSIRNLVKLRALAQVGRTNKAIAEDLVKGISTCGELIRLLSDKKDEKCTFTELGFGEDGPFLNTLRKYPHDSSNRNWSAEANEIEKSLQHRHRRQLHGLYRGWTRAELTLRTQIPAEQLLHWCEELLSDDLIYRCNRLVINYPEKTGTQQQPIEPECYNFGTETERNEFIDPKLEDEDEDLKEFRRFLQDLQVKLWIERSDYRTCIRHRRKHLWHSLETKKSDLREKDHRLKTVSDSDPIDQEIETYQALIDVCEIRQCHQLLYIANCKLKLQQELTSDENELKKETKKVLKLLDRIDKRLQERDPKDSRERSSEINDYNEARLRLLHLQTEAQIGHVSMFSHDGFTGDPKHWKPPASDIKNAVITITQALEDIGARDVHTRAAARSVLLPPTTDAALYLQYRSLFQMFRGRTEWLLDPEDKADGWKKALRSFEMARGGLDNDSSLISALIEIYAAEALLARSRAVLFYVNSENGFHKAQQAFDSARGSLRRARESLLVSPRHLMWRKLFFRITTQYHSDRLLLRYAQLQEKALKRKNASDRDAQNHFETNAREALLRLRRAYQTLVSALDLYLPLSARNEPAHLKRFRWLYRMWWELTLCGYATGRVVIKAISGNARNRHEAHEYVIQQLKWINKADGVDDSALKNMFEKNQHRLESEYYKSLANNGGGSSLKKALTLRRNLIYQANELSKKQLS